MESELHELSAAYALDALDPRERDEFERHLSGCERCREDVAALTETAAALAYAAPPAEPPARLREQLLQRVRSEQQTAIVIPFRRRRVELGLVGALAVAAAAAVALAVWAGSLDGRLGNEQAARARSDQAVSVLGDPLATRRALRGARGELVVARTGSGVLVLPGLASPPSGKTYEAWVIAGGVARPAGLFSDGRAVVLDRPVVGRDVVAVTVEPKHGSQHPTTVPFVSSRPV
jgi:anti-sigma-K factor RskA